MLGLVTGTTACSCDDDDSSKSTTSVSDPGPNSTSNDPGPNDTTSGPTTMAGVIAFTTPDGCITLTATEPWSLHFDGYSLGTDPDDATRIALIADDERGALAHNGDQLVITGRENGETDACGKVFVVESLNSVIPSPTSAVTP